MPIGNANDAISEIRVDDTVVRAGQIAYIRYDGRNLNDVGIGSRTRVGRRAAGGKARIEVRVGRFFRMRLTMAPFAGGSRIDSGLSDCGGGENNNKSREGQCQSFHAGMCGMICSEEDYVGLRNPLLETMDAHERLGKFSTWRER